MKPTLPTGVKIGKPCIHKSGWCKGYELREVQLLAVGGIWAMVRRKGCMPYVCSVKDLLPLGAEVTG